MLQALQRRGVADHGELFDLAGDPNELHNRWNDPPPGVADKLRGQLPDAILVARTGCPQNSATPEPAPDRPGGAANPVTDSGSITAPPRFQPTVPTGVP